jgi:hypothetical protein
MAMIKRAISGQIKEMTDQHTKTASTDSESRLSWVDDILIKDVLVVPTRKEEDIDVNLDEDDEDAIAVRI